jgi:hypothetical protein
MSKSFFIFLKRVIVMEVQQTMEWLLINVLRPITRWLHSKGELHTLTNRMGHDSSWTLATTRQVTDYTRCHSGAPARHEVTRFDWWRNCTATASAAPEVIDCRPYALYPRSAVSRHDILVSFDIRCRRIPRVSIDTRYRIHSLYWKSFYRR